MLGLILWLGGAAAADSVGLAGYSNDMASQLLSRGDVRDITGCKASLDREIDRGTSVLRLKPEPLGQIPAIQNSGRFGALPSQWQLPPWPQVAPAMPKGTRSVAPAAPSKPASKSAIPGAWAQLAPYRAPDVSALLQPLPPSPGKQMLPTVLTIPRPFSLRRYESSQGSYFQIALYGGNLGFEAADTFTALKVAAPHPVKLDGIGDAAFITRIPRPRKRPPRPSPSSHAIPFKSIAPIGTPRPDLVDAGLASEDAPAFQSIPVPVKGTGRPQWPSPAKPSKTHRTSARSGPDLLVLVALFRDKELTMELALDTRLGTPQDLIDLALRAQSRLLKNQ